MFKTCKSIKGDEGVISYEATTNGGDAGNTAGIVFKFRFTHPRSRAVQISDDTIEFEIVGSTENSEFREAIATIYNQIW